MPVPVIIAIVACLVVIGILLARIGPNRTYESELTLDQIRDYFFKRHHCKDCATKLKRISKDEFLGEGWSMEFGKFAYRQNYKRTYFLKCPNCFRMYTSDDY